MYSLSRITAGLLLLLGGWASGQTINVTTEADQFDTPSGAFVSLREALRDAEQLGGFPVIEVPPSYTIALNSPLSPSTAGLTIQIRGNEGIDGSGERARLVPSPSFSGAALVLIDNRPINLRGFQIDGAGLLAGVTGVLISGTTATVQDCVIERLNNTAITVFPAAGATVKGCEIRGNHQGLTASSPSSLTIEESVFYHNRGGAIDIGGSGSTTVTCRSVTVAENFGLAGLRMTGGFGTSNISFCSFVDNVCPGISVPEAIRVSHCIFARNIRFSGDGSAVSVIEFPGVSGMNSLGYNLTDAEQDSFDDPTDTWVPAVKISRLGDFGGERYCCFPFDDSVAIDGGNPNYGSPIPSTDGRGFLRKHKNSLSNSSGTNIIDIGAVEVNPEGTLVVSNDNLSGGGSLSSALAAATGETVHIVFSLTLLENFFNPTAPWVIDETRNYNIDATGAPLNQFSGGTSSGPIFEIGADPASERPTVSLSGLNFRNFAPNATSARGCIRAFAGAKLSLHQVDFENNTPRAEGVVDLRGGGALGSARLFANECYFEGNEQLASNSSPNAGGAALQVTNGTAVVWNSSFIGNECTDIGAVSAERRGGAVRLESSSRATFRQCTFARNISRGDGSAIFATDALGSTLYKIVLDRCTFAENETLLSTSLGAVAFQDDGRILVNRTLFYRNFNAGNPSISTTERDLHDKTLGQVTLTVEEDNWTDSPAAFTGLIAPGNLSSDYVLNEPARYGGKVPVIPILGGTEPSGTDIVSWRYPRDAKNKTGREGFTMPGAVQATEGTAVGPEITLIVLGVSGTTMTLSVTATAGSGWDIHGGYDLSALADTGQNYTGTGAPQTIGVTIPAGLDRYFLRFAEQ